MAHALWRGTISFGLVTIPVGLYSAENAHSSVSFHLLHKKDLSRVHNKRVDEEGHEVPYEDVVKGYEYEKGRYVIIDEEELRKAKVEATQAIDIMHFVDGRQIDVAYYDTPYYIEPLKAGRKAYALMRETLQKTHKVGIAKLVIRERQRLCAVVADGPVLLACTLRWPYQLREVSALDLPEEDLSKLNVSPQELNMAEQLIEAMTADWDPEEYTDTYHDDLMRFIEARVQGGDISEPAEPRPEAPMGEVVDIMALLKRSVEQRAGRAEGGRSGVADQGTGAT